MVSEINDIFLHCTSEMKTSLGLIFQQSQGNVSVFTCQAQCLGKRNVSLTTQLATQNWGHLGPCAHSECSTRQDWPEKIPKSVGEWQSACKSQVALVQEKRQLAYLTLRNQYSGFTKTSHSGIILLKLLNPLGLGNDFILLFIQIMHLNACHIFSHWLFVFFFFFWLNIGRFFLILPY